MRSNKRTVLGLQRLAERTDAEFIFSLENNGPCVRMGGGES